MGIFRLICRPSQYDTEVWELHSPAVDLQREKRGIGRALAADTNLYENLWKKIVGTQNLKGHPYEFYLNLGCAITRFGADANGRGKPDILMGKRVLN